MDSTLDIIIETKGETAGGRGVALDDGTGVQSQALDFNTAAYANLVQPKGFLYHSNPYYSGPVSNSRTFNSSGGAVRVERFDTGQYTVTFDNLKSRLNGQEHVQVKPAADGLTGDLVCAAAGRGNGVVFFYVFCMRNGEPRDMPFEVQVFDHDVQAAFAAIGKNGSASNYRKFSRSVRDSRGRYYIFFKKDPYFSDGARPVAFVTTKRPDINCELYAIDTRQQRPDEYGVLVDCYDRDGRRTDTQFNVFVTAKPYRGGLALVIDDGTQVWDQYSYNWTGGDITVTHTGFGRYTVNFRGLADYWSRDGTAMVTAHGDENESCAVSGPRRQGDDVVVDVTCSRPGGGAFYDSRYTLAVMRR
ncbi:MAG: hypothetical protein P8010_15675 [Desulfosarcinaceae bacterium]|jgi:hypothetical protein